VWREQENAADAAAAGKSEIGSKLDLMGDSSAAKFHAINATIKQTASVRVK
jgi:hypothetical protein